MLWISLWMIFILVTIRATTFPGHYFLSGSDGKINQILQQTNQIRTHENQR